MNIYEHQVSDLTSLECLKMSNLNYDFKTMKDSRLIIDFKNMTHFEPFSMLISSHIFNNWARQCSENNIDLQFKNYEHCGYAGHMGYFKHFGLDYGNEPNEAKGSRTYLPITTIKVNDLKDASSTRREKIQDTIVRKSEHLASILGQGNYDLEVTLAYAIREIMRNVVEHSFSPNIYLAAQRWEHMGEVEIAIFDEGVGIRNTLSSNPNLSTLNSSTALDYCLQPGISGKAYYQDGVIQNSTNSDWDHSGFGLFVTSELCKMGGEFTIISHDSALQINSKSTTRFNSQIEGTGIRLKLKISEIPDLGHSAIDKIIKLGERIASTSEISSITSASKMSRVVR
ncbi:ATP-binding protein [Terribacillus saccharophilus]|uniref:ATP-binding protein n=1 Tax=Terribacillus saccharophilus TaxID=361277 RepID=UPI002DC58758|nr:hypothetical protein [Terribacillus saccharophilus]MEC0290808.1 hypothetical protein [Terribacillus saccharophilus]